MLYHDTGGDGSYFLGPSGGSEGPSTGGNTGTISEPRQGDASH